MICAHNYFILYHTFWKNAIRFKEFLQFNYTFHIFKTQQNGVGFSTTFSSCSKFTKNTTTIRRIFSYVSFLTKKLAKNRTKWIFTNWRKGCIIKSRVKSRSASVLYLSCTTCVFSAKYQSNDIEAQWKKHVVLFFLKFSKKQKFFQKTIDKSFSLWYNVKANKEKFRFHLAAKRA